MKIDKEIQNKVILDYKNNRLKTKEIADKYGFS